MEQSLKSLLRTGETVAWKSRPEPGELLDDDNSNRILRRWVLTTLAALTLLSLYVGTQRAQPVPVLLIVLIALSYMLVPVAEHRCITRCQRYYITNQRVLLCSYAQHWYYMDFSEIDEMKIVVGLAGQKSLVLGSRAFDRCEKQLRRLTLQPQMDLSAGAPPHRVLSMTLYAPKNVESACVLLRGRTTVRESARPPRSRRPRRAA